ncbi:hypothetical protein KP509_34G057000 [Ceratopteris richardii]|uniref:GDP-mannose 4,6-dehydratase n=1 Tax=Ceratopteris richardii TaxID=49495 RepID=A0A8T2QM71_CERRI|nr:hypothetical protein KP509_34G057000 [Ceratopteris richardii]
MPKKALITGITSQDGSYLTKLLLEKGYEVHGIIRRSSSFNMERLYGTYIDSHSSSARIKLHYGDLIDAASLRKWMDTICPHEVYNLGAQSHVGVSFENLEYTTDVVATGALCLLEAIKSYNRRAKRKVRYYQARSIEMYGSSPPPQDENTEFHPMSPYGVSKVAAHWYTVHYREAHGLFACNGILFNHESPRQAENFLTRKITRAVGRIKLGLQEKLVLGNLKESREWGFAGDYVQAMWLMLQQDELDDYVVATEETHTVEELLEAAFGQVKLNWKNHVEIDESQLRPSEVDNLRACANKEKQKLGWTPKVSFKELVAMMI